jgi:hypothetical protein
MPIKHQLAVVIPIYKSTISDMERVSLEQCVKVLNSYPIVFVCSSKLDTSYYQKYSSDGTFFYFEHFQNEYFESIQGYNKLLLSKDFYNRFRNYKYIFIYQLDAYIFKDNLQYYISKNIDFIGAPWINWYWSEFYARHLTLPRRLLYKIGIRKFKYVGNGGFSLRKVSAFSFNLSLFSKSAAAFDKNEDFFFSYYINSFNPFFKVASFKDALSFAFDENPGDAFVINNNQLPMGCHAWPKYLESFWDQYIEYK